MRAVLRAAAAAVLLPFAASPASAHIVSSRFGDFYAGAIHPLTGLADVVLWLALGLLAGLQPARTGRWLLPVFPLGLLAGFGTGLWAGTDAVRPVVDAGGMVVLGGLAALALRLPVPVLAAVGLLLGVLRGAANSSGLGTDGNPVLFGAGLAVAGYVCMALVVAATVAFRGAGAPWRTVALRAGGSWIAAIGLMAGSFALAG